MFVLYNWLILFTHSVYLMHVVMQYAGLRVTYFATAISYSAKRSVTLAPYVKSFDILNIYLVTFFCLDHFWAMYGEKCLQTQESQAY